MQGHLIDLTDTGRGFGPSPGNLTHNMPEYRYAVLNRTVTTPFGDFEHQSVLPPRVLEWLGEEGIQDWMDRRRIVRVEVFAPPQEKQPAAGPWILDPKKLQRLSLEALNLKVAAIDPTMEPFETREEAIAQLSMHHGGV